MGYLDNSSVTVDAVLTKLGRERLAQGNLNITKFALGDDEINYSLYDTSHNLGSAYYGEAIERMPVLEAFTNDPQTLKYKLVTLPKNTQVLPIVSVTQTSITLTTPGQISSVSPQTLNVTGANTLNGYSFTLANSDIAKMDVEKPASGAGTAAITAAPTGQQLAATVNAISVTLTAYSLTQTTTTTLTITGNDTGGTVTIPITVNRDTSLD
tara:strand:- start:32 stop:664 length:633 start_codon:yes stop_codon:yes gene_type:complete